MLSSRLSRALKKLSSALLAALGLFTIAFALVLATEMPVSSAKEVIVNMQRFAFIPAGQTLQANVTVDVGDTVTWVYAESPTDPTGCGPFNAPLPVVCPGHTTTSVDGKWDSKIFGKTVPPSEVTYPGTPPRYSVRFDSPGTFAYTCKVHATTPLTPFNNLQGMKASVIVQGTALTGGVGGPAPVTQPLPATGWSSASASIVGILLLYASWRLRRALRSAGPTAA